MANPLLPPNPPAPSVSLTPIQSAKRNAAYRAVSDHLAPNSTYIGIGSGSTIVYVVEAISSLGSSITGPMTFIPTGHQSRQLIIAAGLRLGAIDNLPRDAAGRVRLLDVAFDGADEVDEELNLIKGGGACLFQEKLVAISARKFVCVADHRKLSTNLLTTYPTIPIEIIPASAPLVLQSLLDLGSPSPALRQGGPAKAGPIVTDNGNFIIDAPFAPLHPSPSPIVAKEDSRKHWDVATLAKRIKEIVGVVEVGLFWGKSGGDDGKGGAEKPVAAYFGMDDGLVMVRRMKTEGRS
ncbi:MAG: ribose-5-phosphate isomerase rki1 [Trichoglossum hirsutum]|nr:MAG: ribose-5-phosphate isomerase rki1 [Trichoglossum hirsutum]